MTASDMDVEAPAGNDGRPPILSLRHISKSYLATRALRDVDFECRAGEVHALLGENGAGKSTLAAIVAGAAQPDQGEIFIDGVEVELPSPEAARLHGIAVVYQELVVLPNLSVEENVWLHREPRRLGLIRPRELRRRTFELFEGLQIAIDPGRLAASLSANEQQMLEIARAMSYSPRVLVMDEPTSSLGIEEQRQLLDLIARLRLAGVAVVYISHRLQEVFEVADRVTILRDGSVAASLSRREATPDVVVGSMLGTRTPTDLFPPRPAQEPGPTLLAVRSLAVPGVLDDVSFEVREGEVLGVWGLVGSGRSTLLRAIFGADRASGGEIEISGRRLALGRPARSAELGVAYLGEDRKRDGLFLNLGTIDNLVAIRAPGHLGLRARRQELDWAQRAGDQVGLDRRHLRKRAQELSGGNQQKVVLGKWLSAQPRVLLLDEPTRGVDVGAKREIYGLMRRAASAGAGVVFVSSELPEVLNATDRVLVLRHGSVVDVYDSQSTNEAELMRAAMGR